MPPAAASTILWPQCRPPACGRAMIVVNAERQKYPGDDKERHRPCQPQIAGANFERRLRRTLELRIDLHDRREWLVPIRVGDDEPLAFDDLKIAVARSPAKLHDLLLAGRNRPAPVASSPQRRRRRGRWPAPAHRASDQIGGE